MANLFTNAITITKVVIFPCLGVAVPPIPTFTTSDTFVFDPIVIRKLESSAHSAARFDRRVKCTNACRYYHDDAVVGFYPIAFGLEGVVAFELDN